MKEWATRGTSMQSDDLTRQQATALKNKLRPMLDYLSRLKRRMVNRGFLSGDPLLDAVVQAENAVHALHVQVHYLSCGDVVGRRRKDTSNARPIIKSGAGAEK